MLMHRIIPCLDVKAGRVVKGVNFVELRDAGDPVEIAKQYDEQGADELVFLDITASHEDRGIMLDVVRRVADCCFMPFTVGGGIRTIEDVTALIQAGAEKVSINTAAVLNPAIVKETSDKFGKCATVVNIDPKRIERNGEIVFEVHTHGGRKPTGLEAVAYAQQVVELGAGEIVLTSMDADGTKDGYDLEITRAIATAVDVPVVASGGCGSPEHMREVLSPAESEEAVGIAGERGGGSGVGETVGVGSAGERGGVGSAGEKGGGGGGGADAALAASIFHYGEYTIAETKRYLHEHGVAVRLVEA